MVVSPDIRPAVSAARDVAIALSVVLGLTLALTILGLFVSSMSRSEEGLRVLGFDNATSSSQYVAVGNAVAAELQRIRLLSERQIPGIDSPGLYLLNEQPQKDARFDVGNVGLAGNTIPLGGLLQAIEQVWPFGGPRRVLTGSLQEYADEWRLVGLLAHVEGRRDVLTVQVTRPKSDPLSALVRDLAYRLQWQLTRSLAAKNGIAKNGTHRFAESWEAYRDTWESIAAYIEYGRTRMPAALDRARDFARSALAAQHDYNIAIGNLRAIGIAYYEWQRDYKASSDLFREVLDRRPDPEIAGLLGQALLTQREGTKALAVFDRGIKLWPDDVMLRLFRAQALVHEGRDADALAVYRELQARTGGLPKTHWHYVPVGIAGCLRRLKGQTDPDYAQLVDAIRSFPPDTGSTYDRACQAAVCGDVDRALELLALALAEPVRAISPAWAGLDSDLRFLADDSDPAVGKRFSAVLRDAGRSPW